MNIKKSIIIMGALATAAFTSMASADGLPQDGNRYYSLPRFYKSEISVTAAYLAMEHSKDYSNVAGEPQPVLIDVRSEREYASGHPEDSYNVPFPTITGMFYPGEQKQTPEKLYWEVYRIVKGKTDTPIMTLCRTGHRSVLAGNILARPDMYNISGPAFTNVRNIWQGFVGQPRFAFDTFTAQIHLFPVNPDGSPVKYTLENGMLVDPVTHLPITAPFDGPLPLDLNNNGMIDSDYADVYQETKDANPDKDGWRNFAGLPWSTQIQKPLAYERNPALYTALHLTPVQ